MITTDNLRRAHALLAAKFGRGYFYRKSTDTYCLLGAIGQVVHDDPWWYGKNRDEPVVRRLASLLGPSDKSACVTVVEFNDNATYDEVLALLDKLISDYSHVDSA